MTEPARIQIGWLTEAIESEDDLADFLAGSEVFGPEVAPLSDYKSETTITHSHGPVTTPVPVYVFWPPE